MIKTKKEKKYIVKYNEDDKKRPRSKEFNSLNEARIFAREHFRLNSLVSLTNSNKVALTL